MDYGRYKHRGVMRCSSEERDLGLGLYNVLALICCYHTRPAALCFHELSHVLSCGKATRKEGTHSRQHARAWCTNRHTGSSPWVCYLERVSRAWSHLWNTLPCKRGRITLASCCTWIVQLVSSSLTGFRLTFEHSRLMAPQAMWKP
jgi:hypothetical protein